MHDAVWGAVASGLVGIILGGGMALWGGIRPLRRDVHAVEITLAQHGVQLDSLEKGMEQVRKVVDRRFGEGP